jgi:hypothetical protein
MQIHGFQCVRTPHIVFEEVIVRQDGECQAGIAPAEGVMHRALLSPRRRPGTLG